MAAIPVSTRSVTRAGPGVAVGVTEEMIHAVVHAFYAKVRRDPALGPIFARVIGDTWDTHLAKMCDFWSSVLLMTGRFKGTPMAAHARLPGCARPTSHAGCTCSDGRRQRSALRRRLRSSSPKRT